MRVTDEMVNKALDTLIEYGVLSMDTSIESDTAAARAALEAALSHAAGQDGEKCRAASGFELMELAAIFESCVPFLPPVGQRNITKAVAELRALSRGVPEDVERAAYWMKHAMGTGGPAKAATVQIAYAHAAAIVRHLDAAIAAQRKEG